jgi:glycosyltransferase involved in cell wall biosynthesis
MKSLRAAAGAGAPQISVIFPVRNERENLPALVEEINAALKSMRRPFEIIAVDDGSTDGSRELLLSIAATDPSLKVVCLRRCYGQSAALDAGFRLAAGDVFVTLDADLQNDPADIPRMIELLEREQLDLVTGERVGRKDGFLLRRLPSLIANFFIRRVTRTRIRDLGCALKVYRRQVVKELHLYGEMHRFIAVLLEGMGAKSAQVPVNHRSRTSGKSKYGLMRTLKVLLDLITVWFLRGLQTKPIYLFGGIGMLLMAGAATLSGFVLYQKLFEGIWVHRNPVFILSMVMAIMAVQFLGMGLIAEMIVRTYFESQSKLPYLISTTTGFARGAAESGEVG